MKDYILIALVVLVLYLLSKNKNALAKLQSVVAGVTAPVSTPTAGTGGSQDVPVQQNDGGSVVVIDNTGNDSDAGIDFDMGAVSGSFPV